MNWTAIGSVLMFLAVAMGAFGAHGLKNKISPDMLAVFETAVRYQVYHALALFVVAWLAEKNPSSSVEWAGRFFLIGIILFSGSLSALSLTGLRWLGAITPLGGLCFLVGWVLVTWSAVR